jgi:fatty-acyl-CoA synthase
MTTVAELVRARVGDARPGLRFEDQSWTYDELVAASAARASLLLSLRQPGAFHVGVLLDNVPEFPMWLGATAMVGATVVGINPTRRGDELARDITHTECQVIVTEPAYLPLLDGLRTGVPDERVLVTESPAFDAAVGAHRGATLDDVAQDVVDGDLFLLLFTSGSTGAPKAVQVTQGRVAFAGTRLRDMYELTARDVCYLAMPMFHSNALFAGWSPALTVGATMALRRRFSASGFLPDVRKFGVTYFNYVGKPLSYILATPPQPDDADNSLRIVFGNEGADLDLERFSARFGCPVVDAYGSTEGAAIVQRTPEMPAGALGVAPEGTVVLHAETGEECPPARFDGEGRLLNPDEAIGELVNKRGGAAFEGYWKNEEANAQRLRNGWYWTGDLAYRDESGYLYFAGRDFEWLRVDGENFAAAPVERIISRHADVTLAAVYAVPDPEVGDQVMAALLLRPGAVFDPAAFRDFLAEQPDLGTKWSPRFVRVSDELPVTLSNKVLKRPLRRERWECADPVWWRPDKSGAYRRLEPADVDQLRKEFESRGRTAALDAV